MSRKIAIFDTTLRDGEQPPGVSMNTEGNIVIARQLVRMNVDVIEAGFPITSPAIFARCRRLARSRATGARYGVSPVRSTRISKWPQKPSRRLRGPVSIPAWGKPQPSARQAPYDRG